MKRFGAFVFLFVSVASSRALARGVKREVIEYIPVTMEQVLSHPEAFVDKRVVFEAYFAGLGGLYRPYYTPFIRDHYVNFRVWSLGSKLWLKGSREDAFLSLYCLRTDKKLTDFLQSLEVLSAISVYGRTKIVHGGYPWLDVDRIKLSGALSYTEKGLKHIGLGMARLDAGDFVLAARSFRTALDEGMPSNAKALVSRHLGEAHYKLGRYADAEAALAEALDLLSAAGQPDPALYMRLGQTHNELKSYDQALAELKKAIDLEPSLAEAHAALGLTLGYLKRYREGLMACDTALKLKPIPMGHRNKAIIYLLMGHTKLAIRAYNDALMAKTSWPLPRKELGDIYMKLGEYEDADLAYGSLVILEKSKGPKAQAHILQAQAQLKQGTPEKKSLAIKNFEKAIEVDPQHIPGYLGLAEIYVELGELDKALDHLAEAVRVEPQYFEGHMSHGRVLEMLDKLDSAAEEYATACELRPKDVEARLRRALALWNKPEPDWAVAITELEVALGHDPHNQKVIHTVGRFYAEVGRLDEAVTHLRKAKTLKEDDVMTRWWLAEAYRRQGADGAALRELKEIESLDSTNVYAKALHAIILASRRQDLNKAALLAEEALRSDPKNPAFLDTLGWVEYQRTSWRAVKLLMEAAETSKEPDAFYHLAFVSHESKNFIDAKKDIEKAEGLWKALPGGGAGRKLLGQQIVRLKRQIERGYKEYTKKYGISAVAPEAGSDEVKEGLISKPAEASPSKQAR